MEKLLDAVRFLLSQHLDHFHPKVQAEAQEHLSALSSEAATSGVVAIDESEQGS